MPEALEISQLRPSSLNYLRNTVQDYFGYQDLDELLSSVSLIQVEKGETLIQQGDAGEHMFLLISGGLEAFVELNNSQQKVGEVSRGECVGEMALLDNSKRTASIIARRNSILVQIDRGHFQRLASAHANLSINLSKTIINRLKEANNRKARVKSKSKFIALHSFVDDISSIGIAQEIAAYWNNRFKIAILREADTEGMTDTQFALHINDLESNDYILLVSNRNKKWNRRIALNADKTVYFVREPSHESFANEGIFVNGLQEQDEVFLVYNPDEVPLQVSSWLEIFQPNRTFKMRLENSSDLHRAVRIITEQQVCLVFGGGGAHGLSNLGVVRALMERNIPIDVIGGTSIGSIFAASLAVDWPFEYVYENMEKDLSKNNPLKDYTLPFVALLKGKKMRKMLKKHFKIRMEETWKNMFCVAANLSKFRTEVIQQGPLDTAIASSVSIPGILPPSLHQKSLLVDGGVLNNMPSDLMRQLYNGHVISVDVVASKPRSIDHDYKLNNWQFLKNTFTGSNKNYVPGTMNTIMKSVTLASAERFEEKEAVSDYYIKPRSKKGFLAWKEMDAFVKNGYEAAVSLLDKSNYQEELNLVTD